ncbi:MAG: hypothetical protein WAV05_12075 [Anaerolineales bacterium]
MPDASPPSDPEKIPRDVSDQIAESFFGVTADKASRRQAIQRLILGAVASALFIPALFYLRFREVGGFGWGITIFFVVYCLLAAIGLYFQARPAYHSPVRLQGNWLDWLGAFWLISCAFGPLFGWMITSIFSITVDTWRWLYGLRLVMAAGFPLITSLPLIRYLRGKMILVALPILVIVTILPIWSTVNVSKDLWYGPILRQVQSTGQLELFLQYTSQSLGLVR